MLVSSLPHKVPKHGTETGLHPFIFWSTADWYDWSKTMDGWHKHILFLFWLAGFSKIVDLFVRYLKLICRQITAKVFQKGTISKELRKHTHTLSHSHTDLFSPHPTEFKSPVWTSYQPDTQLILIFSYNLFYSIIVWNCNKSVLCVTLLVDICQSFNKWLRLNVSPNLLCCRRFRLSMVLLSATVAQHMIMGQGEANGT